MRTTNLDPGQRQRLERERAALVQQLARINRMLRQRVLSAHEEDWDFDPRTVSVETAA
jgi:hypothetical protein